MNNYRPVKPSEPFIKLDGQVYTKSKIEQMSSIQITELINRIPPAIDSCNNVMETARKAGDKKKVSSISFAKKQLQNALNWISVIRKKKNIQFNRDVNENFRAAAKAVLTPELFEDVCLRAQAMAECKAKGEI